MSSPNKAERTVGKCWSGHLREQMADHSAPTVAGITLDSEAKLEPDAAFRGSAFTPPLEPFCNPPLTLVMANANGREGGRGHGS